MNPVQRLLIDAMGGERLSPSAFELSGVLVPRRLLSPTAERITADPVVNPLAFLMTPASVPTQPAAEGNSLCFMLAAVRRKSRRSSDGFLLPAPLSDQVEIACASEAHATLIWEKALHYNWPVTLGTGIPAALTRPGRALIGFCDWIETDFSAGHFRRLLQSGDLGIHEKEGFTAGQAARLLARAEAGWGRATYGLALGRLHKSYQIRADHDASAEDRADAQLKTELTERFRNWIDGLVASVPEQGADGKVELQTVVSGALDFIEHATARSSALDHRAAAALREYIDELRALGPFSCGLSEALRFIRERIQSLQVAAERTRPGHLYACGLSQCGYAGRQHLFIVGLEEGRVFSSSTEDAVLLDAERRCISADLRLSTDRVDEAVYALLTRLAASTALVTFSYSCRDTREFRETYASWVMLQAFRLQQGKRIAFVSRAKSSSWTAKVRSACRSRDRALLWGMVAAQRRGHRR